MTANALLADGAISHAVDLQLYSNHVVRKIIALLNRTDADLFRALTVALEGIGRDQATFSVLRLEGLLASVRTLNASAYASVMSDLTAELRAAADYELEFQSRLLGSVLPAQVSAAVTVHQVGIDQVYAAAMARPFQGRLLAEWAKSMEDQRMVRVRDAVRMGVVQGETNEQIVRRIRGTRARGYADGLVEIDRRGAEAVVRTAVSHTTAFARQTYFESNADLIKALKWTATLDSRTSELCRIRDGKLYTNTEPHRPIDHKIPWLGGPGLLHWCCRSISSPVLKSWQAMGIPAEDMPQSTRASMDGQVPEDTTYAQWLARQSAARQDEILGATRGALMRRGGLTMDRFYNAKGVYLTLDDLRARDAAAFEKAGV